MKAIRRASGILCLLLAGQVSGAENVIEDEGVGMTREELEFVVQRWTPQMQRAAAVDRWWNSSSSRRRCPGRRRRPLAGISWA